MDPPLLCSRHSDLLGAVWPHRACSYWPWSSPEMLPAQLLLPLACANSLGSRWNNIFLKMIIWTMYSFGGSFCSQCPSVVSPILLFPSLYFFSTVHLVIYYPEHLPQGMPFAIPTSFMSNKMLNLNVEWIAANQIIYKCNSVTLCGEPVCLWLVSLFKKWFPRGCDLCLCVWTLSYLFIKA